MMHSLVKFLFVALQSVFTIEANTECYDAYECVSSNVSLTSPNSTTDLQCYGYKSCFDSYKLETTNDATIQCLGSYACYQSQTIQHTYDPSDSSESISYGDIICCGLGSCADAELIYNKNGSIACDGELSCSNSNIESIDEDVFCLGDGACANTSISLTNNKVYFSGHLAGANSIFYNIANDTPSRVVFTFDGAMSGNGSEIICGKNNTCKIYCHSNGCNNLKVTCEENACILDVDCGYAELSDLCPNGASWDSDFMTQNDILTIPINLELNNINQSMRNCENSQTAAACDAYLECSQKEGFNNILTSIDAINSTLNTFCCSAFESCNGENDNINIEVEKTFRCDGTLSCANILLNYTVMNINKGDLYLSAYAAGAGTEMVLDGESNIYCNGMESCYASIIRNVFNLYANGVYAAKEAELIQNVYGNIYAFGVSGIAVANVENVIGNIYCGTQFACSKTNINGVGGSVLASGYIAAGNGVIMNVAGDVIALGRKSMFQAQISNVSRLFCNGAFSCKTSILRNIGSIYATQHDALTESIIISERGESDGIMSVILNSTIKSIELYCNASDTCNIECQSEKSCYKMNIHCFGTCNVICNETNGFSCPNFVTYEPTGLPTDMPPETTDIIHKATPPIETVATIASTLIATETIHKIETSVAAGPSESTKNKQHSKYWCLVIGILIAVLIVAIICAYIRYYGSASSNGNGNEKKDDEKMKEIYRATSHSVPNPKDTDTNTKTEDDGEDTESSKDSEPSGSSGSGKGSDKQKFTLKVSGEV